MNEPVVFDIQRFCLHDGPGIRTLVFFKGCPLSCRWCCNPESQSFHPELMRYDARCIGCGQCLGACPRGALEPSANRLPDVAPRVDRDRCDACDRCAAVCPTGALERSGRSMPLDGIVAEVLRDRTFFDTSGGGVTLSGGEPLAQPNAAAALLAEFQSRYVHTTIETCGHVPWPVLERTAPLTDLFLFDLKHVDEDRHRAWTGVGNGRILDNLKRLSKLHRNVIVRIPLVPGFNADPESCGAMATVVREVRVAEIHLLPFHRLGQGKYLALGRDYPCGNTEPPDHNAMIELARQFQVVSSHLVSVGR